jgi:hypothetical protein
MLWENDYDMRVQSDQVRLRGGYDHEDKLLFRSALSNLRA